MTLPPNTMMAAAITSQALRQPKASIAHCVRMGHAKPPIPTPASVTPSARPRWRSNHSAMIRGEEACAACHAAGAEYGIDTVHARLEYIHR